MRERPVAARRRPASGDQPVGVVALEDLLEEVIGEFDDETDPIVSAAEGGQPSSHASECGPDLQRVGYGGTRRIPSSGGGPPCRSAGLGLSFIRGGRWPSQTAATVREWAAEHDIGCTDIDVWKAHEERRGGMDELHHAGDPDLVVTLGGDGTFLRGARIAAKNDAAVLGVDLGKVGFLTEVACSDVEAALEAVHHGGATYRGADDADHAGVASAGDPERHRVAAALRARPGAAAAGGPPRDAPRATAGVSRWT